MNLARIFLFISFFHLIGAPAVSAHEAERAAAAAIECADLLLNHVKNVNSAYKPIPALEEDLRDRHNAILLLRVSVSSEDRPFSDFDRIGGNETEVSFIKDFRFFVKGYYVFAVQGEPIQLLDFVSRLGFADESLSYQILHSQISSTTEVDVSIRPRVIYFDPQKSDALAEELAKLKESPERGILALPKDWTEAVTILSAQAMRPLFADTGLAAKHGFKVLEGKATWLQSLRDLKGSLNQNAPVVVAHADVYLLNGVASEKLVDLMPLTLPSKPAAEIPLAPELLRQMKECFSSELCRTTGVVVTAAPEPAVAALAPPEPAAVPEPQPIPEPVVIPEPQPIPEMEAPPAAENAPAPTMDPVLFSPEAMVNARKIMAWAANRGAEHVHSPEDALRHKLAAIYSRINSLMNEKAGNAELSNDPSLDPELNRMAAEEQDRIDGLIHQLFTEQHQLLEQYADPKVGAVRIAIRRPQKLKHTASLEEMVFSAIQKMYTDLARAKRWKIREISDNDFRVIELTGSGTDLLISTESGVHRVYGQYPGSSKSFQTYVDVRVFPARDKIPRVMSEELSDANMTYIRNHPKLGTMTQYTTLETFERDFAVARQVRVGKALKKLAEEAGR